MTSWCSSQMVSVFLQAASMIPTPDLSHLKASDYDKVYEPAEDTFILLDAIEEDVEEIKRNRPNLCYEIGPGSGCVSAFIASILKSSTLYLSSDINPYAASCTRRTGVQNGHTLDVIQASLYDNIRIQRSVDLLLFNPPYVPTEYEESTLAQQNQDISGAWAGGNIGMDLTNKVLENLDNLLSDNGVMYLVAIRQNNPQDICQNLNSSGSFDAKILISRRAGRETLFVIKCARIRN
ncbi:hypothetical protein E3Q23_02736 [Wallemia mellicola]|uniref:Putative methylase n=1 Tax=Wallemia mellicola TaxID=1708541 RepID=A0A4T0LW43_9BASI|nr:hypothetical protein E3Q23_02736 [Wallemia mellicola]TIC53532.1 putative methylase [Wallemia mellicola]TIC64170.1 putative methylase [Wallemia mellicola]